MGGDNLVTLQISLRAMICIALQNEQVTEKAPNGVLIFKNPATEAVLVEIYVERSSTKVKNVTLDFFLKPTF